MGYACPVCDDPQADAEHLANHLAFTAMLRGDDHEAWLDDHVTGWAELDPPALAKRVVDRADETEFPQVFEDTTGDAGQGHDHDHGRGGGQGHTHGGGRDRDASVDAVEDAVPGGIADLDDVEGDTDPEDVLAEARELTRQRRENAADGDETAQADDSDGAADEDATEAETGDEETDDS